jgi:hypothetical protein
VNTFDVKVWRTREERALIRVTVELEAATCYVRRNNDLSFRWSCLCLCFFCSSALLIGPVCFIPTVTNVILPRLQITFSVEPEFPQYRIVNLTQHALLLQQKDDPLQRTERVPAGQSLDYAW